MCLLTSFVLFVFLGHSLSLSHVVCCAHTSIIVRVSPVLTLKPRIVMGRNKKTDVSTVRFTTRLLLWGRNKFVRLKAARALAERQTQWKAAASVVAGSIVSKKLSMFVFVSKCVLTHTGLMRDTGKKSSR